jgi:hypothetical protein
LNADGQKSCEDSNYKVSGNKVTFTTLPRLGLPPFSVPWPDISAQKQPHRWRKTLVRFNFAREPELPFKVFGVDTNRIVAASHGRAQAQEEAKAADVSRSHSNRQARP